MFWDNSKVGYPYLWFKISIKLMNVFFKYSENKIFFYLYIKITYQYQDDK